MFSATLPATPEHRKLCTTAVRQLEEEKHLSHAVQLGMQGVWTNWIDQIIPFDLSWKNLIWGPGPRVISFALNAAINSLPTPDMLALMGYKPNGKCNLCGMKQCTLFHILVNCKKVHERQKIHLEALWQPSSKS